MINYGTPCWAKKLTGVELELFFGIHPKLNSLALDTVLPSRFLSLGA